MPSGLARQQAWSGTHSTLPHDADDHAGAGRGGRGRWRTPHERRRLVPWAQEAERIGVPAPHHGGVQAEAKHATSAILPLKSWLVEKPQPNRKMLQPMLVAVFSAALLATRLPSR
jgi:hypothetical protein